MPCKNSKENNTDISRHRENKAEGKSGNKNKYQTGVVSHFLPYSTVRVLLYKGHFHYDRQEGEWLCLHEHNILPHMVTDMHVSQNDHSYCACSATL